MKRNPPGKPKKAPNRETMRSAWPQTQPCRRLGRHHWLRIRLDPQTYRALQRLVGDGGYSFLFNIEEAIYTAVRGMIGAKASGLNLDTLVRSVAYQRDISFATALFGGEKPEEDAAALFLTAAHFAAHGVAASDIVEFGAAPEVIALLKQVLPHRDLDKEIADVKQAVQDFEKHELEWMEARPEDSIQELPVQGPERPSPDDIPF
jgi:hypothetical protein